MISALFVESKGVYANVRGVDPWPKDRDARAYPGKNRVIAHPPCARWGKFWPGNPSDKENRFSLGDDRGCFAAALFAVRTYGGIIEHPSASRAWPWFGLPSWSSLGGWWGEPDPYNGRTCKVEQGNYGHMAPKETVLYAVIPRYPDLRWGPSGKTGEVEHQSKKARLQTPEEFRDLLIKLVAP